MAGVRVMVRVRVRVRVKVCDRSWGEAWVWGYG